MPRYNLARSKGRGGQEGGRARAVGFPAGGLEMSWLLIIQSLYGTEVSYSEIVLLFQAKCLPGKNILNCAQRVLSTVALLTLFGEGD